MLLLVIAVGTYLSTGLLYLCLGSVNDARDRRRSRRASLATGHLARVILGNEEEAAAAANELGRFGRPALLVGLHALALDVDGEAHQRIQRLAASLGISAQIRRKVNRARWRGRAQLAPFAHLLPPDDPVRQELLDDPHPVVRARAVEGFTAEEVVQRAGLLLAMLDDPHPAVSFAAQQQLLQGTADLTPHLVAALEEGATRIIGSGHTGGLGKGDGAPAADRDRRCLRLLEIATYFPDPRLGAVLAPYGRSQQWRHRELVAQVLAVGLGNEDHATLEHLLADPHPAVRAAAVRAVGQAGVTEFAGKAGGLLADPDWSVRREAGAALAGLGATGSMVLRAALFSADRYARDMAHQVLDQVASLRREPPVLTMDELSRFAAELEQETAA